MTERKLDFGIYTEEISDGKDPQYKYLQSYICNLYRVYLPKVKTINLKKINIELSNKPDRFFITYGNLNSDIIAMRDTFDFEGFSALDLQGKKEFLLQFVYDCLTVIFEKLKIDLNVLKSAHDLFIKKDAELLIVLAGGPKLNRKKDSIAKVIAEFFISGVLISVVFTCKNGEVLKKINLLKTFSHHIFYLQLIKTAKWLDNEVFQISDKAKEINIQINIGGKVLVNYSPTGRDIDSKKEEIRYYNEELFFEL